MFLIRQSMPDDVSTLVKLARTVHFINLPASEAILAGKIEHSASCFRALVGKVESRSRARGRSSKSALVDGAGNYGLKSDFFMFTIEEPHSAGVIGTSQIVAHMGGPGDPNWGMKVTEKEFHSESLRFGTTHTVGQLYGDESGPTEIGGLVLDPGFRGHEGRPGRFLSFARFHFMGLYRDRFADRVLAEMMAPVTGEGDNPFWDAFGRKFIPVKYAEADRFCQQNRRFIHELLPKEEIYLTLLPLEVINTVAVVARETLPARRLLESLGFRYRNVIDPFDGGPHLDVPTDEIPLVKNTRSTECLPSTSPQRCKTAAIVSWMSDEGEFRATQTWIEPPGAGALRVLPQALELLGAPKGATLGYTPLGKHGPAPDEAPHRAGGAPATAAIASPTKPRASTKPGRPSRNRVRS